MKLRTQSDLLVDAHAPVPMPESLRNARIAIVHYWFVSHRGGERVVEEIARMFPGADLFALVADPNVIFRGFGDRPVQTSFLQNIPGTKRFHRQLLPLYPLALEQFDLRGYDLVISSESGPAKGVLTSSRTCHICYCHSPMRYLWDFYHRYRSDSGFGFLSKPLFTLASHYLRLWDSASANRVDYFVANSRYVAGRIRKHYRRDAMVIHPPVNVAGGFLSEKIDNYYLAVGQLVDYKRMDLAISACHRLGRPLHIVGSGEQYKALKRLAGPSIKFLGALSDEDLREQYAHCRALLFPGEEDFGIVPVEALSFGRPVIAYDRGGVRESVKGIYTESPTEAAHSTGVFFREQSVDSLVDAIVCFEEIEKEFNPFYIKQQAERFAPAHFHQKFENFLTEKWGEFQRDSVAL